MGTTLNDLFEEQNEDFESISDEENLSCEEDESEEYDSEETEETDEECNESYEENSDGDNLSQDDYNPPSIKLFKKIMIDILRGSEENYSEI